MCSHIYLMYVTDGGGGVVIQQKLCSFISRCPITLIHKLKVICTHKKLGKLKKMVECFNFIIRLKLKDFERYAKEKIMPRV